MVPLEEQQVDKIVIYQKRRYFILYILFSFIMAILCLYCVFIELKDYILHL